MADGRPIAVFDSGVGGISVLARLVRLAPGESYLYFGDSANAPYGARTEENVRRLSEAHAAHLLSLGAKAIVIACNTATGAAAASLREKYPDIPIIGIEPAVKPAAQAHPGGRILVMATPVTLAAEKFRRLMAQYAGSATILPAPCSRLARMIEDGILGGPALETYLHAELDSFLADGPLDAVVLGCTHYPFVREAIARVSGTDAIYDGGEGTARQTLHRLALAGLLADPQSHGTVTFLNSDPDPAHIALCRTLLDAALHDADTETKTD